MNLPAIEKMNKSKELADKIGDIVEDWLDSIRLLQKEDHEVDLSDISANEWLYLESRIERLLGEE